jgi:hypothetical protein
VNAEGVNLTLTVPVLVDASADGAKAGGNAKATGDISAQASAAPSAPPSEEPSRAFWPQKTVGIGLAAAGVVGIGASVVLALAAKSRFDEAKAQCVGGCDAAGASVNEDAISRGNTATIVFGVAAAAIVAGGVLWLTAPSPSPQAQRGARAYRLGVTTAGTGFVVRGVFE